MFNIEEIKDLMTALDSWERDDGGSTLMTLMGGMLQKDDASRDEYLEKREAIAKEAAQEKEIRKEKIVLLKAKLISMRSQAEVKEFGESVLSSCEN